MKLIACRNTKHHIKEAFYPKYVKTRNAARSLIHNRITLYACKQKNVCDLTAELRANQH